MSNVHIVVKGDNLSKIAKRYAISLAELRNINELPDPNKLRIGQKIRLRKEQVLGFQALVLDNDRNPIEGLAYQFDFAGRVIKGITGLNGLTKQIMTPTPQDQVRVLVERLDKSLKEVASVTSGYGNKLVTLVSPSVKIEVKTEMHPDLKPGQLPDKRERAKPIYDPKVDQPPTTNKKNFGLKATAIKTPDGKPLVMVEGDILNFSFLDDYNGDEVTEDDYLKAANELDIEKAAIKAFALVESSGSGYFTIGTRRLPKILYERHKFSEKTGHRFSAEYPDISLPAPYYNSNAKYVIASQDYKKDRGIPEEIFYYRQVNRRDSAEIKMGAMDLRELIKTGKATAEKDKYLSDLGSYKRLAKAFKCDQVSALESCSWGAFQIMGEYWKVMKYTSVESFTKAMARSPKEQLISFVRYIKYVNPRIKIFLKNKDWESAAKAYNGPSYKDNKYDIKLEAAYNNLKNE